MVNLFQTPKGAKAFGKVFKYLTMEQKNDILIDIVNIFERLSVLDLATPLDDSLSFIRSVINPFNQLIENFDFTKINSLLEMIINKKLLGVFLIARSKVSFQNEK